jgi:hypothetical protein
MCPQGEQNADAASKASRAKARALRRAAALALTSAENADGQSATSMMRMASMIQANITKTGRALNDDANSIPSLPVEKLQIDEKYSVPMTAASAETWGGIALKCDEAASRMSAVDYG